MKKLIFILIITVYACHLQAAPYVHGTRAQTDTAQRNKQIAKLNLKLANLNNQLADTRSRIPVDSVKLESALSESHEAQVKSRKRSEQAVGGDTDDARLAEKQAKKAAKLTNDAEGAAKQLEQDRKKVIKLTRQIEKTQKKLDEASASGN
jgi:transcription initiation factor IIF auxiliary subunit